MGVAGRRGRGDKRDCRYRECLAQTARENELRNSPCAQDFRTPGGRRQRREGGVREMRVTRPVTEFPDRPLLDDPPSGDAHRRDPHSREVEREIMHWTTPPYPSKERRSATDCLNFASGRRHAQPTGEGVVVLADHPPATEGTRSEIADRERRPAFETE